MGSTDFGLWYSIFPDVCFSTLLVEDIRYSIFLFLDVCFSTDVIGWIIYGIASFSCEMFVSVPIFPPFHEFPCSLDFLSVPHPACLPLFSIGPHHLRLIWLNYC